MFFLILWFLLIMIASVIPVSTPYATLSSGDKLVHAVMYGLTSIFVYRICLPRTTPAKAFYLSVAISALYGAAIEVIQYFLPYRSFSFGDMTANTLGAFCGSVLYRIGKNC